MESSRHLPLRELSLVALLYACLTVVFAYPLSVRPGSVLFGDNPDTHLFMWTLAWDVHALVTQPLQLFDANIYHPNDLTLAYSENLLGLALMVAPVLWVSHNPVLAINVAALLSCVLCGVGAYVLARRLGLSRPAAMICGLVFAFSPPRFVRNGQLHVGAIQWIPFTLAFLHSYLDGGRRRDLLVALLCYSLQAITSGHGAVFLTFSVAALLLFRLALGEPVNLLQRARDAGVTGAIFLLPAVLIYLPYARLRAEMGFRRDLEPWNPTLTSFIAAPVHFHTWLMSSVAGAHPNDTAFTYLFPGYLPLLLALGALIWWRRDVIGASVAAGSTRLAALRHDPTLFYLLFTLFWVGLLLPPAIGLWPHLYWLPGLNQIRAPSRFAVMVVLGLSVLAAVGFDRITARGSSQRRRIAGWIASGWLVIEFAGMPIPVEPFEPKLPAVDRWVATQDGDFAIAEFPVRPAARYQSLYTFHSTAHWKKTVHGYSGYEAPWHAQLYQDLRGFPDDLSLQRLREYGVRYAVVHETSYTPEQWQTFEARVSQFSSQLVTAYDGPDGRVYRVQ